MRLLMGLCVLLFLNFVQAHSEVPSKESTKTQKMEKKFGGAVSEVTASLDQILDQYKKYAGQEVTFEATAKKVCAKKGCWMVLDSGKNQVRTLFKDYGFFVPASIKGKKVRVTGVMNQKKVSAATIRHYMKDEGKKMDDIKKVKSSQVQYQFVATGVEII